MSCSVVSSLGGSRVILSLAHVGYEENHSEYDAKGANHDVADGKEVVAASEHVSGREYEGLGS
jgi:hypothetical protein